MNLNGENMADNVIEVKSLLKKYGNFTAVNDISFNIKKGEIFAFLGPNGAGKTTTVEILECLKNSTAGSVNILGGNSCRAWNRIVWTGYSYFQLERGLNGGIFMEKETEKSLKILCGV